MRLAVLKYDGNGNIGDEIQTLAAEQFLPRVDLRLDRDSLAGARQSEPTLLLMNGWFAKNPRGSFPPAEGIDPVFFSFHIARSPKDAAHFFSAPCLEYFRRHQPVGCRDKDTAERLRAAGVEAYYTKCLTLTFPRRPTAPRDGRVFIVDVDTSNVYLPRELRRGAVVVTHHLSALYDDEIKSMMARKTLELYRNQARLVITSRVHCALPCSAMGIPVVFLGDPRDVRMSVLEDIGIKIHPYRKFKGGLRRYCYRQYFKIFRASGIDWNPKPLDLEEEKSRIVSALRKVLKEKGIES
jgi:hypothetical protein